jgi:hypothetical protein
MAEFNFYITDKEREEFIDFILSKGSALIPDNSYSTSEFYEIKTLEDYIKRAGSGEHKYFIIDNKFTFEPIIITKNRFSEKPLYSVYQRKGGPYIDLSFYLGYAEDAAIPCKSSRLDHYARFIQYNSYEEFKAPEELKTYFKDLVNFVKAKCKSVKKNGKAYWISK